MKKRNPIEDMRDRCYWADLFSCAEQGAKRIEDGEYRGLLELWMDTVAWPAEMGGRAFEVWQLGESFGAYLKKRPDVRENRIVTELVARGETDLSAALAAARDGSVLLFEDIGEEDEGLGRFFAEFEPLKSGFAALGPYSDSVDYASLACAVMKRHPELSIGRFGLVADLRGAV